MDVTEELLSSQLTADANNNVRSVLHMKMR